MKRNLLGLILFVSTISFSQQNPVDFSMSFVTNPVFKAGLDESALQGDIFQIVISLNQNNPDSLGALNVMIYDFSSSALIIGATIDRQQIASGLYAHNGSLIFNFPYLNPIKKYKVILDIQNSQQAYLPRVEKNFPTN